MQAIIYEPRPNSSRIKCFIPFARKEARAAIKAWPTSYFHYDQKLWSVVYTQENMNRLRQILAPNLLIKELGIAQSMPQATIDKAHVPLVHALEQKLLLKAYSASTIRNYKSNFCQFLHYFSTRAIDQLTVEEVEHFLAYLVKKYHISSAKQNALVNSIKAYYEHVLGRERIYYDIQRPKKAQELPGVLSKQEVKRLINQPKNLKHRAMLYTVYSSGLRSKELLQLRVVDVHSDDGYLFIKAAKGKKDRQSLLSPLLLKVLRQYYREYKPSYWLFEGQSGEQYSASSLAKVFRRAAQQSGLSPWATLHSLRHSFATHLVQNGVNLRIIQSLLGHASPKTTEIYTHISLAMQKEIESPLDSL